MNNNKHFCPMQGNKIQQKQRNERSEQLNQSSSSSQFQINSLTSQQKNVLRNRDIQIRNMFRGQHRRLLSIGTVYSISTFNDCSLTAQKQSCDYSSKTQTQIDQSFQIIFNQEYLGLFQCSQSSVSMDQFSFQQFQQQSSILDDQSQNQVQYDGLPLNTKEKIYRATQKLEEKYGQKQKQNQNKKNKNKIMESLTFVFDEEQNYQTTQIRQKLHTSCHCLFFRQKQTEKNQLNNTQKEKLPELQQTQSPLKQPSLLQSQKSFEISYYPDKSHYNNQDVKLIQNQDQKQQNSIKITVLQQPKQDYPWNYVNRQKFQFSQYYPKAKQQQTKSSLQSADVNITQIYHLYLMIFKSIVISCILQAIQRIFNENFA